MAGVKENQSASQGRNDIQGEQEYGKRNKTEETGDKK